MTKPNLFSKSKKFETIRSLSEAQSAKSQGIFVLPWLDLTIFDFSVTVERFSEVSQ